MQRRIFMSSPELFISRACAKRYRAREGGAARRRSEMGGERSDSATASRLVEDKMKRRMWERQGGKTRRDRGPAGEAKTRNETADCR